MLYRASYFILSTIFLFVGCEVSLKEEDLSSGLSSSAFGSMASEDITGSFRKGVLYTFNLNVSASFMGIDNSYSLQTTSNKNIDIVYDGVTYDGKDARIQLSNSAISSGTLELQFRPLDVGDYALSFELNLFSSGSQQVLSSSSQDFEVFANTDIDNTNIDAPEYKFFTSEISVDEPTSNRFDFSIKDDNPYNTYDVKITYESSPHFSLRALSGHNVIYPIIGFTFEGITDLNNSVISFYLKVKGGITDLSLLHGFYDLKFVITRRSDGLTKEFNKQFSIIDNSLLVTSESGVDLFTSRLKVKEIMYETFKVHYFPDHPIEDSDKDSVKLNFDTSIVGVFNPEDNQYVEPNVWYSVHDLKTSTENQRSLTEFHVIGKTVGEATISASYKVESGRLTASESFNVEVEALLLSEVIGFTSVATLDNMNIGRGTVNIFSGTPTMHNRKEPRIKITNKHNSLILDQVSMAPRQDTPHIELRGDLVSNNVLYLGIGEEKVYTIVYTNSNRASSPNSYSNVTGCYYGSFNVRVKNSLYSSISKVIDGFSQFSYCTRSYSRASINQNGVTANNDVNGWSSGPHIQTRETRSLHHNNCRGKMYNRYHDNYYYRIVSTWDNWGVSYGDGVSRHYRYENPCIRRTNTFDTGWR